MNVDKIHLS